jgi:tight adherence protein B
MMLGFFITMMLGLIVFCLYTLRQDSKERRIARHVSIAMGAATVAVDPRSIRLSQKRERFEGFLRIVLNYRRDAPRAWPAHYSIMAGLFVMLAINIVGGLIFPQWIMILVSIVAGCVTVRMLFAWQLRRYQDKLMRQLPDVTEMIVGAVKAGMPISEAFYIVAREMPSPTKDEFVLVAQELALGRLPEDALRTIFTRTELEEYAMFSVTLAVQSKAGGRLSETLQILGDTIRERVALAGRAKALASEAQLSARVLAALPFVAGLALFLEKPTYFDVMLTTSGGQEMIAIGLTTVTLGIITMRRMIRKGITV